MRWPNAIGLTLQWNIGLCSMLLSLKIQYVAICRFKEMFQFFVTLILPSCRNTDDLCLHFHHIEFRKCPCGHVDFRSLGP